MKKHITEISVRPPYILIISSVGLISSLIILSTKIPVIIRIILIIGLVLLMIFNGFRKIVISKSGIEIFHPFGSGKKLIKPESITKIKVSKGPRAGYPFSFKVYYNNISKTKSIGFGTEQYKYITRLMVQFLRWEIPLEISTDNIVKAYYQEAKDELKKEFLK